MYPDHSSALEIRRRTANQVIPGWAIGLLSAFQAVLWLAIIGLEGVNVYYGVYIGTIWAGFWCSGIFFMAWVSMCCFCKFLSSINY